MLFDIISRTVAGLHEETFVSVVGVTEVTDYLTQFVCCVGRIRISLTLTRCGWLTA